MYLPIYRYVYLNVISIERHTTECLFICDIFFPSSHFLLFHSPFDIISLYAKEFVLFD